MTRYYETIEEIIDKFKELGFKLYKPADFSKYEYVPFCMDKHYKDDKGIKFSIHIIIYDWTWTNKVDGNYSICYETQCYQYGTHNAVNMEFFSDWKLEDIINTLDIMLESKLLEHYELD